MTMKLTSCVGWLPHNSVLDAQYQIYKIAKFLKALETGWVYAQAK